jgi:hypothetical protein
MIIGVVMQSLVLGYITFKTDWNEQVNNNDDKLHICTISVNGFV